MLGPAGGPTSGPPPRRHAWSGWRTNKRRTAFPTDAWSGWRTNKRRTAFPTDAWSGWRTNKRRTALPTDAWSGWRTNKRRTSGPPYVRCRTRPYLQRRGRMAIPVDGWSGEAGRSCGHGRKAASAQRGSIDPIVPDLPRPPATTGDDPRNHPASRGRAGRLRAGPLAADRGGAISPPDERLRLTDGPRWPEPGSSERPGPLR